VSSRRLRHPLGRNEVQLGGEMVKIVVEVTHRQVIGSEGVRYEV
jgi:hypothetical protein